MHVQLSVLMITKNSEELLTQSFSSIADIADEIVIVDDHSTDDTLAIAKKFNAKIFQNQNTDLGAKRAYGLTKCNGVWVLMLDADEIISHRLKSEIKSIVDSRTSNIQGYYIPYQNHLFGKLIRYGGENYKILRLFKRNSATIKDSFIHEHVVVRGKTDYLKNNILHYSYRRPCQIIRKFTGYAKRDAAEKGMQGEKSSLKKLILYPLHMTWARYIKDKGYKDGLIRLFLDCAFGYMEFCTYLFLFFEKRKS